MKQLDYIWLLFVYTIVHTYFIHMVMITNERKMARHGGAGRGRARHARHAAHRALLLV